MTYFLSFFRKFLPPCLWALMLLGTISGLQMWERALTHGFTKAAILQYFPSPYEGASPGLDEEQQAYLLDLFSKPFSYLAKGAQSFVFESADHQYVFKCFKDLRYSNNTVQHLLHYIPAYRSYMQNKIKKRHLWETVTTGCHLAVSRLPEETGIFYLHLEATQGLPPIVLIDRRGRSLELDVNELPFYLQKKGTPLKECFCDYRNKGDLEGAKKALRAVFVYLTHRSHMEILDTDPSYARNMGFIGALATNLDLGQLTLSPSIKEPKELYADLQLHLTGLRDFFTRQYPELVPFYDQEMQTLEIQALAQ